MIVINTETCQDISMSSGLEWIETNGTGGYASSTITGANTRRYHGLLVAAAKPPLGRTLLLSKLEESVCTENKEFPLSTNFYPNTVHPEGYKNLVRFSLNPFPVFDYNINGINIQKTVFMVYGENTTVILYHLRSGKHLLPDTAVLKIRVLVAFRDHHWLTHENPHFRTHLGITPQGICLQPYETLPPMYLFHNAHAMDSTSFWYKNMEYPAEIERGLDAHEDHYSPFTLQFNLKNEGDCYIVASTKELNTLNVYELLNKESNRRKGLSKPAKPRVQPPSSTFASSQAVSSESLEKLTKLSEYLIYTSDSFIVKRDNDLRSIIAGYHWFGDWGRDTMISLPGLTLIPGRFEDARKILLSYARYTDKGMIPNRFPDYSERPEYNTADASLWYIHAVYQYLRFAKDFKTVRNDLYGVLKEITDYYMKGTRYNIHMDSDGLIHAGAEGIQLTWMDAKVGNLVVTPRMGKAVEINALWYNALKIMSFLAREMNLSKDSLDYNTLAQKVHTSFNDAFWFHEGRYLYDYINGETRNNAIRPNQVFAVSLPYSMLSVKQQRDVLEVIRKHLLTPYGLRTLSPEDKDYIGCYKGNVYERDTAYHQGTVWAWLIGPYISACTRAYTNSKNVRIFIKGLFEPFYKHLFEAGLGTISEIFDGDPPHTPRGCISQAWSVAEILRAYFEHVYGFDDNR